MTRLYDVNASCLEVNGDGGDGAYDLIGRGRTVDEILSELRKVLTQGFGLTNAGECYLSINVVRAGFGDAVPM
jgi:hypothetical protein